MRRRKSVTGVLRWFSCFQVFTETHGFVWTLPILFGTVTAKSDESLYQRLENLDRRYLRFCRGTTQRNSALPYARAYVNLSIACFVVALLNPFVRAAGINPLRQGKGT